jgi:hypothetical protein
MAGELWDSEGLIRLDFLPRRVTRSGIMITFYADMRTK